MAHNEHLMGGCSRTTKRDNVVGHIDFAFYGVSKINTDYYNQISHLRESGSAPPLLKWLNIVNAGAQLVRGAPKQKQV